MNIQIAEHQPSYFSNSVFSRDCFINAMSCPSDRYSLDKCYRPEGQPVFVGNQLQDHLGLFTAGFIANVCVVTFHLRLRALKKHYIGIF